MSVSVLLVCENDDSARAIRNSLGEAGFEVQHFTSALDAVACFANGHSLPACLVTETGSLGISGWDLARIARQSHHGIAVVYLGSGDMGDWLVQGVPRSEMLEAGWRPAELPAAVVVAIGRTGGRSEIPVAPPRKAD
jgi:CheY-like chemotaxis protein